ncbi:MAG: hypothetical protein LBE31_11015, partial [Deltaproteobacteria bacterium]|nr:hypothetical protein [Deltaproteobacteria bacterium]
MKALAALIWLTFLLSVVGCVQVSERTPVSPTPKPSDLTIQAGQAYDRGDYATAANLYRRYLSQNPQSPRRETI